MLLICRHAGPGRAFGPASDGTTDAMNAPHAAHRTCQTWAGALAQAEHGWEDVPTMLLQRGYHALAQVCGSLNDQILRPASGQLSWPLVSGDAAPCCCAAARLSIAVLVLAFIKEVRCTELDDRCGESAVPTQLQTTPAEVRNLGKTFPWSCGRCSCIWASSTTQHLVAQHSRCVVVTGDAASPDSAAAARGARLAARRGRGSGRRLRHRDPAPPRPLHRAPQIAAGAGPHAAGATCSSAKD